MSFTGECATYTRTTGRSTAAEFVGLPPVLASGLSLAPSLAERKADDLEENSHDS
jgi:hypothetical protein